MKRRALPCAILQDEQTMYAYEGAFSDEEVQEWLDRQQSRYREYGFGLCARCEALRCKIAFSATSESEDSLVVKK